jgi:general L-amino acid transport system substrate-binding protein
MWRIFFGAKEMSFMPVTIDNLDELMAVYRADKCSSYTADQSQLYAIGLQFANPNDHLFLPGVISKEPLQPAVRHGDE